MIVKPVLYWKSTSLRRIGLVLFLPLAWLFGAILRVRHVVYDLRPRQTQKFKTSILCVGSLSVGGSGKTPVAEAIALRTANRGLSCVVISTGYRKRSNGLILVSDGRRLLTDVRAAGDEAFVMANHFIDSGNSIPVLSSPDRVCAIAYAEQQFRPVWIILDDGFQDRRVHPTISLLVQDFHELNFAQRLLPVGRLRDLRHRVKHANAVVVMKAPEGSTDSLTLVETAFGKISAQVVALPYCPEMLVSCMDSTAAPLELLSQKLIIAFSGLGYNESFRALLESLSRRYSSELVAFFEFNDHHWYEKKDISRILSLLDNLKEDYIVITTEKDSVKTDMRWIPEHQRPHFYYLRSQIMTDSMNWIDRWIGPQLQTGTPHG